MNAVHLTQDAEAVMVEYVVVMESAVMEPVCVQWTLLDKDCSLVHPVTVLLTIVAV